MNLFNMEQTSAKSMNKYNNLMNKFKWSLVAKWVRAQSLAIFTSENTNFESVSVRPLTVNICEGV